MKRGNVDVKYIPEELSFNLAISKKVTKIRKSRFLLVDLKEQKVAVPIVALCLTYTVGTMRL